MKTTLELTIVQLRLVQSDEEFSDADPPTLSGMRCAADVGETPGLVKCKAAREFPWRKRGAK